MEAKMNENDNLLVYELVEDSMKKGSVPKENILNVNRLPGDASTRTYYRISTDNNRYVVCLETVKNEFDARSNFLVVGEAFLKNHVRTPIIYDTIDKSGYILQEDLGDETLLMRFAHINSIEEEYDFLKKAVDNLIKIHKIKYENYPNANFAKLMFDQEKLLSEMNFSIKNFFINFLGHHLSEHEQQCLILHFENLCKKLSDTKFVLCHRDFHTRNIMVVNEELVLIDFQDARIGIPQYDLVSILEDCYHKVNDLNVEKIKRYYWDNFLKSTGYQKSYEDFEKYYNLMAIQRIFKAVGSFSFFVSQRKDYRYLKYIGYAMEKLKEFLFKDSSLNELRKIIYGHYYTN